MKWILAIICTLLASSNSHAAEYEFAFLSFNPSGQTWTDKSGTHSATAAELIGEEEHSDTTEQSHVLILNALSKKGWEIEHISDAEGGQTYLLKHQSTANTSAKADGDSQVDVVFTGGFDTEPQDRGRPVILVANGLNVPPEVFRKAFGNVKPAGPGQEPAESQVRKNKQVLMEALQPYGVTNDRLDEVSNYYRYSGIRGQMWKHTPAAAYATVRNRAVVSITITNPGAGYSSPPKVTVAGKDATAVLSFGTDLSVNGSIKEVKMNPDQKR